jgi:hypothetical protein
MSSGCSPLNGRAGGRAVSLVLDLFFGVIRESTLAGNGPLTEIFYYADFVPVDIVLAV